MAIGPNVVDDCEGMTEEDYWRGMDEAMQDEEGDEPFCTCSTGHGIEETDWNQCDSCGKPIYDEEPAVPPAPTFADGMTAEDDMRFLDLTNDLTHNGEVRGASRPAGEASSAEGATSTVVLGADCPGKEKA